MAAPPFGAILAGGESRRYGRPKALVTVGGVPIIERVRRALAAVLPDLVLIANEPDLFRRLELPVRPDVRRGAGVLAGIHTALLWAREEGRTGVLAVACDMPCLESALLERLREEAERESPDIVIPESRGRRGVEPLCAYYGTRCIEPLEAALDRGDRRMISFHEAVDVRRLPLAEVLRYGDPEHLFLNVNTPADRDRAERLVLAAGAGSANSMRPTGSEERHDA